MSLVATITIVTCSAEETKDPLPPALARSQQWAVLPNRRPVLLKTAKVTKTGASEKLSQSEEPEGT